MASNLINALNDFIPASLKPTPKAKPKAKQVPVPVATTYESADVAIPPSFLVDEPTDARGPVTSRVINWEETPLPEHASRDGGRYAVILDNVLSPSECDTLLRLTESSVPLQDGDGEPWKPALVNVGYGREVLMSEYRNSDRIIWDTQEVMDRLWARCARAPGVLDALATVEDTSFDGPKTWEFARFNQRGRFLKYTGGQFFRPHCDGAYHEEKDGKHYRTFYTVHLYLNDSVAELGLEPGVKASVAGVDLVGGATSFLSSDEKRRLDVNPKAGRVLIFQHRGLYHSGDDVTQGTKYTMRTDILYVEK